MSRSGTFTFQIDPDVGDPMDRLRSDPLLRPLLDDLCQWLRRLLGIDISANNFTIPLASGADLCRLAEAIASAASSRGLKCPGLKYKPNAIPGSFQARCNIEAFVKWAKSLGVKETCLFETVDIVERKYLRNVLICLLEVSKKADVLYGVEPPELVKLEKDTSLSWQDLIKLSMRRTSTDTAMSVAAIRRAVGMMQKESGGSDLKALVTMWKRGTKLKLKEKGVAVSDDPDRILEDSYTTDSTTDDTMSEFSEGPASEAGDPAPPRVPEVSVTRSSSVHFTSPSQPATIASVLETLGGARGGVEVVVPGVDTDAEVSGEIGHCGWSNIRRARPNSPS
eukprot:sb/3466517/